MKEHSSMTPFGVSWCPWYISHRGTFFEKELQLENFINLFSWLFKNYCWEGSNYWSYFNDANIESVSEIYNDQKEIATIPAKKIHFKCQQTLRQRWKLTIKMTMTSSRFFCCELWRNATPSSTVSNGGFEHVSVSSVMTLFIIEIGNGA